jgi:hypothetical protein
MRTNGEPVSLRIGERTVLIGDSFALTTARDDGGRTSAHLFFKPYWPGLMHAVALISDGRKQAKQKNR